MPMSTPVERGCGTRRAGGVYIDMGLVPPDTPGARPVEDFIEDPPLIVSDELRMDLGVRPVGVTLARMGNTTHGQLYPLIVRKVKGTRTDGVKYVLVDGRRRLAAARAIGWEGMKVIAYPANINWTDVLTIVANTRRSPNPVSELQAIKDLMARGADEDTISKATGMTKQAIRARLKLADVPQAILDAVGEGTVAPNVAVRVSKLTHPAQEKAVAVLEEHGRLTHNDVSAVQMVRHQHAADVLFPNLPPIEVSPWPEVHALLTQVLAKVPDLDWQYREAMHHAIEDAEGRILAE